MPESFPARIDRYPARQIRTVHPAFSIFSRSSIVALFFLIPMPVSAQAWPVALPETAEFAAQTDLPTMIAALVSRPDVLDLEMAVSQAELVLAVRLVEVTETKIVHGGRNVEITEQYRFEPVRVLKGIFARESLLLTGQDLGIYRFAGGSERLARGQLLLVLLGRQGAELLQLQSGGDPFAVDPAP